MAPYSKPEYVLAKAEKLAEDNKKEHALEVSDFRTVVFAQIARFRTDSP
jgi:hypothetical protein